MPGSWYFSTFKQACDTSVKYLLEFGVDVDPGRWQGVPTEGKPDLITREVMNLQFDVPMYREAWEHTLEDWVEVIADEIKPNREWADEHFAERVGGKPLNPDPSYVNWPWWRGQESSKQAGEQFTHTYSERFWPKEAGEWSQHLQEYNVGIRYRYGDLNDLLDLLERDPQTRQAYLPIFFPEDTGAVHGGRIPCTLGYHFLLRERRLYMWYHIRSCDAVRHFRDDIYLAARLCGHIIQELAERELRSDKDQVWYEVDPGVMHFNAYSFHVHKGDMHLVAAK